VAGPPDLDRVVASLASAVRDAMTALYDLQAAVANTVAEGYGSSTLLDQLKRSREVFRANWEEYIQFLRRCRGYADDYIALCKYSSPRSSSHSVMPATELLATAKKLFGDAQILTNKHDQDFAELRKHKSSIVFLFRRSSTLIVRNKARLANADRVRSHSADSTLHQFVQAAEASLRPDGPRALRASETALNAIHTSLRDLTAVWEGQKDHLSAILSKPEDALPKPLELKNLMQRWGGYRRDIQLAVSSISESSDAATVDAVGATQIRSGKDSRSPSFWQRFFGKFKRR